MTTSHSSPSSPVAVILFVEAFLILKAVFGGKTNSSSSSYLKSFSLGILSIPGNLLAVGLPLSEVILALLISIPDVFDFAVLISIIAPGLPTNAVATSFL